MALNMGGGGGSWTLGPSLYLARERELALCLAGEREREREREGERELIPHVEREREARVVTPPKGGPPSLYFFVLGLSKGSPLSHLHMAKALAYVPHVCMPCLHALVSSIGLSTIICAMLPCLMLPSI